VEVRGDTPAPQRLDIEASVAWFELEWRARFTWNGDFDAPGPATFAAVCTGYGNK